MRALNHPNYQRTYWTPERRQAASDRAKERWRIKRERQEAEWNRIRLSPLGRVQDRLREEHRKMENARVEFFRARGAIEQLEKAREALQTADSILSALGLSPLEQADSGGERR